MDRPDLDPDRHRHALAGLERINAWSGSAAILWPAIRDLAEERKRPLKVLDIATGAGDVPLKLWRKSQRHNMALTLEACDRSDTALLHARAKAREAGAPIRFFPLDALADPLPAGFDVICCSLFLHHLTETQAIALLMKMKQAARHLVLVNDLRRSWLGWLVAWVGCRTLTRSDVVHVDGPLSVKAAFTRAEAMALAARAGLHAATVSRRWPWRWLLTWRSPS